MKIAVYCSSSDKIDPMYFDEAKELGKLIAQHQATLVYGGVHMGLMGAVAKKVAQYDGKSIGIVSQSIHDDVLEYVDPKNLTVTPDLQTRKTRLMELSDAHIALPGGFGTLDEVLGVLANKQVGESTDKVVIINTNGFYDAFIQQLEFCYKSGFAHSGFKAEYFIAQNAQEAITYLFPE